MVPAPRSDVIPDPIRVLLVDDHPIVREGLRLLLATQRGIEVVGEAADGHEACSAARALEPDVVVLDLALPGLHGVDVTRTIRAERETTRVLVLSMHGSDEHVRPAVRAGASGFLVKGAGLSDIAAAIIAVAAGNAYFSPGLAERLVTGESGPELSQREREVLVLVAQGYSTPQIGAHLGLSAKTVEGHRGRIMTKLGIHDIAGLVRFAIRAGLVSADA